MPRSDAEIWQEILSGDAKAWKELIKRYQALVNTVAVRSGLSMADAADCFQTTWVRLYENRYRIQDASRLSAWLVTTAKREAIRLRRIDDRTDHDDQLIDNIPSGSAPDAELELLQQQSVLENGLAEIDDRCRKLLHALFFAEAELSYEEVSQQVGISFNSLGPIRQRCLARLKSALEDLGYSHVRNTPLSSLSGTRTEKGKKRKP
ncbi:MAG: sigma-70 family RNA polymerase sigma factor [Candidatus Zixiibacteriota bacterium]